MSPELEWYLFSARRSTSFSQMYRPMRPGPGLRKGGGAIDVGRCSTAGGLYHNPPQLVRCAVVRAPGMGVHILVPRTLTRTARVPEFSSAPKSVREVPFAALPFPTPPHPRPGVDDPWGTLLCHIGWTKSSTVDPFRYECRSTPPCSRPAISARSTSDRRSARRPGAHRHGPGAGSRRRSARRVSASAWPSRSRIARAAVHSARAAPARPMLTYVSPSRRRVPASAIGRHPVCR